MLGPPRTQARTFYRRAAVPLGGLNRATSSTPCRHAHRSLGFDRRVQFCRLGSHCSGRCRTNTDHRLCDACPDRKADHRSNARTDADTTPAPTPVPTPTPAPTPAPTPPPAPSYAKLSDRQWALIVKSPDDYVGKRFELWTCIWQFDAATGPEAFLETPRTRSRSTGACTARTRPSRARPIGSPSLSRATSCS